MKREGNKLNSEMFGKLGKRTCKVRYSALCVQKVSIWY